jgi:hypothetical protein
MPGKTWQEYDATGTRTLGHEEIEQAIARLEQMWDEAQARTRTMTWYSPSKSAANAATGRVSDQMATAAR